MGRVWSEQAAGWSVVAIIVVVFYDAVQLRVAPAALVCFGSRPPGPDYLRGQTQWYYSIRRVSLHSTFFPVPDSYCIHGIGLHSYALCLCRSKLSGPFPPS